MITIGVDPGLDGAIAVLHDGRLVEVMDMPTVKLQRNGKSRRDIDYGKLDVFKLLHNFMNNGAGIAVIEKVSSMPNQGVSSTFAFGKAAGSILGAAGACGWRIEEVPPATWKKSLGLIGKDKNASRDLAMSTFPESRDLFKRVKDNGRAEAALIAHYGASKQ